MAKKDCPYLDALVYILVFLWNVFAFSGAGYLVVVHGVSAWIFVVPILVFMTAKRCKCKDEYE